VLKYEGKCWTEFYKYVKRHKGDKEDMTVIKDDNGLLITDSIEKANYVSFYCSSVFSSERRISQTQCANSCEPFASNTKIISRRLAAIGKKTNQYGQTAFLVKF
jgi:hypothetical protein